MNNETFDRTSLRLSATLLLVGQLLYVVITLSDELTSQSRHSECGAEVHVLRRASAQTAFHPENRNDLGGA